MPGGGKSQITFSLQTAGADTDLDAMEKAVRAISYETLEWLNSEVVDLGFYGLHKLVIVVQYETEKVVLSDLQAKLEGLEDFIQNVEVDDMKEL